MKDNKQEMSQEKPLKEERKLAAIMFTDIQGFTLLMAKDEPSTVQMVEEQLRIMEQLISQYDGRLLQTMGDGVMADFGSAVNAVRCGIEIQKEIGKYNKTRQGDERLLVRIGIHVGDILIRGNKFYGDGINIASRIEPLAEPGGICVSKHVHDKIKGFPDIKTVRLGPKRLKNVEEPLEVHRVVTERIQPAEKGSTRRRRRLQKISLSVFVVIAIGIGTLLVKALLFEEAEAIRRKPIAVMAFKNRTGDESLDYLSEAIPNLLITDLEQSRYLSVMTWERMYDLLKTLGKEDIESINDDLGFELCRMDGIDAIVLGSFTKAGDMFATEVKVLDVQTKRLLQTASSKGESIGSILRRQIDELSKEISRGVGISDGDIEATELRVADVTTASMDAYNYFLRGRDDYERFYYDDARRFLERATELDSSFAQAYLYLAFVHGESGNVRARDRAYGRASAFAHKATDKERLYIKAYYASFVEKNVEKRFEVFKKMAKSYPKEKRVHSSLAVYYYRKNLFNQAIEEANLALALDPDYGPAINQLAYSYAGIGDFEKAISCFNRYASVSPGDANPFDSMGDLYLKMGRLDEAIAKYKEALAVKPDFGADWRVAYIYALKEEYEEAMKWIDRFIATAVSPAWRAEGYLWKGFYHYWLGSLKQSLDNLEKVAALADSVGNHPLRVSVYGMKGRIYRDRGEFELSARYYKKCLDSATDYDPGSASRHRAYYNFCLGLLDLEQGRVESAMSRLGEIRPLLSKADAGVDETLRTSYYASLYGGLLLARDSVDKSITVYGNMPSRKAPSMSSGDIIFYNILFSADELAKAYQSKGEIDRATAEYERLTVFDPQEKSRNLVDPRHHYRLAKLYEQKSLSAKAIAQYESFLETWKNADSNLPEVKDARQRLAKLRSAT